MSETRDFVREEGKEKNSIIIVLLQAHTHIHAGETRFLSPLLYIYTYICVYIYMYIYSYYRQTSKAVFLAGISQAVVCMVRGTKI